MTKEIKLTQGKVALVDDEDFEYLNQWKWYAQKTRHHWYAARRGSRIIAPRPIYYMHKEIIKDADLVDHKDGNGLNNTRKNLRAATRKQNVHNSRCRGSIGYKGVVKVPKLVTNPYRSGIMFDGKFVSFGFFPTEKQAAQAWNDNVGKYHGEFAVYNVIVP